MRTAVLLGWTLAVTLAVTGPLRADIIWHEGDLGSGQAGNLPATAQVTVGSALDGISGTLETTGSPGNVDMYKIFISDPANFSATTVGQPGTVFDTQLFLFNANGKGVEANDDVSALDRRSTLGPVSAPGFYYLAISAGTNGNPMLPIGGVDPVVPGGLRIFPDPEETLFPIFGLPVGPTGPGGGLAIAGWTGTGGETGTYTIALTGAAPAVVVPEPSSLILFGLTLIAAGGYAWRKKRRKAV